MSHFLCLEVYETVELSEADRLQLSWAISGENDFCLHEIKKSFPYQWPCT